MIDERTLALLVWGGGVVILAAIVMHRRIIRFQRYRNDRRKAVRHDVRRDLLSGGALFIAALGSALAIAFVLFGTAGTGPRGFMTALALGGFVGALFVMATEDDVIGEVHDDGPA